MKTDRKLNVAKHSPKLKTTSDPRRRASMPDSTYGKHLLASYEHIPIGIVHCSPGGKYIDANGEFCRITGLTKSALFRKGIRDLTHEDDYALDIKLHEQLVAGVIPFYRLEKRFVRKDGEAVWVELTRSIVRDPKGKPLYTVGVVLDISERRDSEKTLRESAERLRLATEAARMFTWEWDFHKQIYTVADSFVQVLGFSAGLMPKDSVEGVRKLLYPDDLQRMLQTVTDAIASQDDVNALECRVINPDNGQVIWLELNAKVAYDDKGKPERMFGVAQNITETKRTEELRRLSAANIMAAAEANAKFRAFFEQGSHFAGVIALDGTLMEANRLSVDFCGFTRENVIGKKFWDCGWWNRSPALMEMIRRGTAEALQGNLFRTESTYFIADGSERYVDLIIAPVKDETGKILFLAPTGTDITERKRAEQALQEYAQQREALYQLADQLHRTNTLEGVFTAALDAIVSSLQCDRASILLFDQEDVMHFVAWRGLSDDYRKATDGHSPWTPDIKNPEPISVDDVRASDLSDALKAVIEREGISSLAFIPLVFNEKLIGKFMVYFDTPHVFDAAEIDLGLTIARQLASGIERQRAEADLRQSEERFRQAANASGALVYEVDLVSGTSAVIHGLETLAGYEPHEIEASNYWWHSIIHPDDLPRHLSQLDELLKRGGTDVCEYCVKHKNGDWIFVQDNRLVIQNEGGQSVRLVGAVIDITGRKAAEAEKTQLLEREQAQRLIAEQSMAEAEQAKARAEQELSERRMAEEALGAWADSPLPAYARSPWLRYGMALAVTAIAISARIVLDPLLGDFVPLITIFGALAFSVWYGGAGPALLSMIVGYIGIAWFVIDPHYVLTFNLENTLGLTLFLLSGGIVMSLGDAMRRAQNHAHQSARVAVERQREAEFRLVEQQRVEAALRASEERYRTIVDTANEGIWYVDRQGVTVYLNQPMAEILGYTVDEVTGHEVVEFCFDEDIPGARSRITRNHQGEYEHFDFRFRRKDGSEILVLASTSPVRDAAGEIIGALGMFVDITERRRAEEALARERELLERLFETMPVMVSMYDPSTNRPRFNSHFEKLIGWKPAEVTLDSLVEACYPDPEYRSYVVQALAECEDGQWIDVRMQTRTGHTLDTSWSNMRFSDGMNVGIGIDITERKRAEEALRASEERYRGIVNQSIGGIAETDLTGRFTMVNDRFCEITGYTRAELLHEMQMQGITHPEDLQRNAELFGRLITVGTPFEIEKRYIRSDGSIVWVHNSVSAITDADGKPQSAVAVVIDVTGRKRIEDALRLENERFMRFVDSNIVGIVIGDANGRITLANDYYLRLLGFTRQDFVDGKVDWKNITPPEWLSADEKAIRQLNERGVCEPYEKEYIRTDGKRVPVYIANALLPGPGREIAAFVLDITERKSMEEQLRAREAELEQVINQTPFMLTRCTRDLRYRFVSKAYAEMIGLNAEEVAGKAIVEVMGKDGLETIAPHIERVLQGEYVEYESEIAFQGIGTPFLHVAYTPDWDEQGNVIGWFASIVDISERKRVEEQLRASEALYRTIARSIPGGGVYVVDKDFRYLVAEGPVTEAFGLTRELLEGHTVSEVFSDDPGRRMEERLQRTFAGETVNFETEFNGRTYWTQQAPILDPSGHAIILTIDITERKQTEEALRESEERFSAILRQATAGIVRKDADGRLLYVNQAFCNMLGHTEDELVGKTIWDFMHPDDIEANKKSYDRLMLEAIPFKLERRFTRRDGSLIWVDASVSPIMDVDGKPQSAVTIEVDITGRKQAEAALQQLNLQLEERVLNRTAKLRETNQTLRQEITERIHVEDALRKSEATALANEEKLRTLFDLLPVGISFLSPGGNIIQMNSALPDILRLTKDELLNRSYKPRKYIRANGMPMSPAEFASARALAENRTIYNVETGVVLEGGEVIWASVSAAPVNVADVGVVVVTMDITESKRVERALQESRQRLQILSQRLVEVQEDERRALARELHDRVGQTLAALNINLIIINSQLPPDSNEKISPRLNDSMKLVAETIKLVRDVMTDLRPAILDDYGLEAALEAHLNQYSARYDIQTLFEKPSQPIPRLGASVEMTFLRIAQEALINIAKHAHASQVSLSLKQEVSAICLTIQDNGTGIQSWQNANRPGSHGLTIMRERAEAFGGNLRIRSVSGKGTTVEVTIPFSSRHDRKDDEMERSL